MSIRACSPSSLPAVLLFGLAGCYSSHHAVGDVESDVCCDPDIGDEGVMDPLETDEQEETPDLPPPDTWLVMLGEENFGWSFSAAQDGEGGIMAVGTKTPQVIDLASDPLGLDFWILRIDGQGRSVWQKIIPGDEDTSGTSITPMSDGNFLVAASIGHTDGAESDLLVLKMTRDGMMEWKKRLSSGMMLYALSVHESTGGTIVIGARAVPSSNTVPIILWMDGQGSLLRWTAMKAPEIEIYFFVTDIDMSMDGGFYMAGVYMDHRLDDEEQASVGKLDADGNILWLKAIGGFNEPYLVNVLEARDGGVILSIADHRDSGTILPDTLEESGILVRLGATGEIIWQKKSAGGFIRPGEIIEASSGNLLFAGSISSGAHEQSSALLAMIDVGGDILWQKTLTLLDSTSARPVLEGPDGEILLAGETGMYDSSLMWPFHDSKIIFARMTGTADIQGGCGPLVDSFFSLIDMDLTVMDVSLSPTEETIAIEDSDAVLTDADAAFHYICPP